MRLQLSIGLLVLSIGLYKLRPNGSVHCIGRVAVGLSLQQQ